MTTALPETPLDAIGARRLSRGISATWWYTATGVLFFQVMTLLIELTVFLGARPALSDAALWATAIGGLAWCAACIPLLLRYRHRDAGAGVLGDARGLILPLLVSVAFGVLAGLITGLWLPAAMPVVQSLIVLNWAPGLRLRVLLVGMALLAALWFIDWRGTFEGRAESAERWWMFGVFAVLLPAVTVMSLWWWDVLVALDRARAAEARLSATQERLRVATDVHDLQGHHLQVIALQLELAERLLADDPDGAAEQLRLARASVNEARQGTRDLAMRFRGVPLPDEIANAVDLLRAAGTSAAAEVDAGAERAPASVLGPVIRETTTNAIRHGGGEWARLSLRRTDGMWRYEIANDPAAAEDPSDAGGGSGLDGIRRRVEEAGGTVRVERGDGEFRLTASVPEGAA